MTAMKVVNGDHTPDVCPTGDTTNSSTFGGLATPVVDQEMVELLNNCQELSVQRTLQKLEDQVTSIQKGLEIKKTKRMTIAHLDKKLDKILSVLERNGFVVEE